MSLFGIHAAAVSPSGEWRMVERAVDQLVGAGIRLIELPLSRPGRTDTRRLRDFADRSGMELFCSTELPRDLDIEADMQAGLDFLEPALRDCAALGSFGLGGVLYRAGGAHGFAADPDKAFDAACRLMERAARLARPLGLKLAVEPAQRHDTVLVNRAADAVAMIERIGAENLFISLDSFPMQTEEDGWASAFETAAPFLAYVRIAESHRGLPGRGMLDWQAVLAALGGIDYLGPVTLHVMQAARRKPVRFEELMEEGLPFIREQAASAKFQLG